MAGGWATLGGAPKVLYLVYWGALEPLGQALVLPSVKQLAELGAQVTLVTFDKPEDASDHHAVMRTRQELASHRIRWISLRYHKRPQVLAKIWDVVNGWARAVTDQMNRRAAIVHARTFVGGLMGLVLARVLHARFIYHNEGFYPDEQVDGSVWKLGSFRHRVARHLEADLYGRADGIIALSQRAKAAIEDLPAVRRRRIPIAVVPSAVDLNRFQSPGRSTFDRASGVQLIYAGTAGGRYRFEYAVRFAVAILEKLGRVKLSVFTRTERRLVEGILRESGLPHDAWCVDSQPHSTMSEQLARHDVGLYFLNQGLSEHGCSPTRIGEYWACGLPVVMTPNIGDTEEIVRRERVGVVVREQSDTGYREAVELLTTLLEDPELRARCRRAAETHYALRRACDRQMALYNDVVRGASEYR